MNYKSISLISGTLLLSTLSANGQKKDSKPNIIFILCDDMGYGDLGCYGQPFIRTLWQAKECASHKRMQAARSAHLPELHL